MPWGLPHPRFESNGRPDFREHNHTPIVRDRLEFSPFEHRDLTFVLVPAAQDSRSALSAPFLRQDFLPGPKPAHCFRRVEFQHA